MRTFPKLFAMMAAITLTVTVSASAERIRLLIIDGQNNHDWRATTRATKSTLEQTGRFTIDVSTSPGRDASPQAWDAWRPDFARYKVVVSNYNGQLWPEPVRRAFETYVRIGGGVVCVHAANNAFPEWPEYNRMIGLGWRGADFGDRVTLDAETGKQVRTPKGEGPGAGHGPQHAFAVTVRHADHPIMRGVPGVWVHAKDELYHGQRGPGANMTILSTAHSAREQRGTGAHEPITWLIPYGRGKVVTTVMGHLGHGQKEPNALHCVGFQTVLARSAEWVATGNVTIGVPADFPTADKARVTDPRNVPWPAAGK